MLAVIQNMFLAATALAALFALEARRRRHSVAAIVAAGTFGAVAVLLDGRLEMAGFILSLTALTALMVAAVLVPLEKTSVVPVKSAFAVAAVFALIGIVAVFALKVFTGAPAGMQSPPHPSLLADARLLSRPLDLLALASLLFVPLVGVLAALKKEGEE